MPGTWGFKGDGDRVLEFPPAAADTDVAPPDRARIKYNEVAGELQLSTDGGAFISFGNPSDIDIDDNDANAFLVHEAANNYIRINTTNGSEAITLGNTLTSVGVVVKDNAAGVWTVSEAANVYITLSTANATESLALGQAATNPKVLIASAGGQVGFYGGAGAAKQTVTGSKGGNAALTSLMAALVAIGLFTDTTS